MAERCCRVRRCGRASLGVRRRAVRPRVRVVAEIVEDGDGIVAVDAMSSGDVVEIVRMRRGRSIVRSRGGSIRRRLCCLR